MLDSETQFLSATINTEVSACVRIFIKYYEVVSQPENLVNNIIGCIKLHNTCLSSEDNNKFIIYLISVYGAGGITFINYDNDYDNSFWSEALFLYEFIIYINYF